MYAVRVTKELDSEYVSFPELRAFIGKKVEIIVLGEAEEQAAYPPVEERSLVGSVLRYDDPFDPMDVRDWETLQ